MKIKKMKSPWESTNHLVSLIQILKNADLAQEEINEMFNADYKRMSAITEPLYETILDYAGVKKDNYPIGEYPSEEEWLQKNYYCRDYLRDLLHDYSKGDISMLNLLEELADNCHRKVQ